MSLRGSRAMALVVMFAAAPACVPSSASTFRPVDAEVQRRLGLQAEWRAGSTDARVPAAVAALLTNPLDRNAAVRIAIANSRRLQAEYEQVGIAAAAIADATVLRPTEVDFNWKRNLSKAGDSETEVTVVQDVLDLVQLGQRRGVAGAELEAAQRRAVAATVDLVARVEFAYYDVVAAQQEIDLRQTAFDASAASAEIVERQHVAGNTTDLALARERDMREEARLALGEAQAETEGHRETLNSLLGLSGDETKWTIVDRLSKVPNQPPPLDDLEQVAVGENLELAAIRSDAEAAAGRVGLARVRAWLPEIGVGAAAADRKSVV